jgi:hypothetical protein
MRKNSDYQLILESLRSEKSRWLQSRKERSKWVKVREIGPDDWIEMSRSEAARFYRSDRDGCRARWKRLHRSAVASRVPLEQEARWELDRRLFRRGRKRRLVSVTGWNYHSEPVPRKLAAKLYRTNWDGCRRYFKEARANQTTCDWDDPRLHRRSTVPRKLLESAVSGLC